MRFRACITLCTIGVLLTQGAVRATTVVSLDLAALSRRASSIFLARCLSADAIELNGKLHTRLEFEVIEGIKGRLQHLETVLLSGGERDGVRHWLAGMPAFVPGEELVLFLSSPDQQGRSWPIGLAQGAFRVVRDGAGQPIVVRREADLNVAPPSPSARPAAPVFQREPLGQFLERVRRLASPAAGGPDAR